MSIEENVNNIEEETSIQTDQLSLNDLYSLFQNSNIAMQLASRFEQSEDYVKYFVDFIRSMSPELRETIVINLEKTLKELYKDDTNNKNNEEEYYKEGYCQEEGSEEKDENEDEEDEVIKEEEENIRWRTLSALSEANHNFSLIFMNLLEKSN